VVDGTATLKTPDTIYLKPGFTANSGCNLTISVCAVTSDKYYYLKDHLGSIRVVVDTVGEIVSYNDYDPWGMILNGRSSNFGFADDKYKFTGKELDTETGYFYFGARAYDGRIGRWNVVDPLFEKYPNVSPYNYALNNPLRFIDPKGMEAVDATPDDPDDKKKKQQETTINYIKQVGETFEKGFKLIADGVSEFISDNSNKLSSENLSDKSSNLALASTIAATCDPEPVSKTMLYSASGAYTALSIGFDIVTAYKNPNSENINKLVFDAFTKGAGDKISKTLRGIKSIQNDSKAIDQLFKSFWNTGTWGASHIIF
jgi:RHS repeat-associated protein